MPHPAPCALRRGVCLSGRVRVDRPDERERRNMPNAEKVAAVAEITEHFSSSSAAVITEYRGLTVKQVSDLRHALGRDTTYAVVKNTLTKRAAAGRRSHDRRRPARRADRDRLRQGRPGGGGEGPARLRPGQPAAGHQGRRDGRQDAVRRRDRQDRRPRVARGAAGQARRVCSRRCRPGRLGCSRRRCRRWPAWPGRSKRSKPAAPPRPLPPPRRDRPGSSRRSRTRGRSDGSRSRTRG